MQRRLEWEWLKTSRNAEVKNDAEKFFFVPEQKDASSLFDSKTLPKDLQLQVRSDGFAVDSLKRLQTGMRRRDYMSEHVKENIEKYVASIENIFCFENMACVSRYMNATLKKDKGESVRARKMQVTVHGNAVITVEESDFVIENQHGVVATLQSQGESRSMSKALFCWHAETNKWYLSSIETRGEILPRFLTYQEAPILPRDAFGVTVGSEEAFTAYNSDKGRCDQARRVEPHLRAQRERRQKEIRAMDRWRVLVFLTVVAAIIVTGFLAPIACGILIFTVFPYALAFAMTRDNKAMQPLLSDTEVKRLPVSGAEAKSSHGDIQNELGKRPRAASVVTLGVRSEKVVYDRLLSSGKPAAVVEDKLEQKGEPLSQVRLGRRASA